MPINSPKVTVLISTFNRPGYLKEAVESMVVQNMTDWELLIMNDGGVDVAPVVNEFNDPRIRYFPDSQNRGAAHRFNFGLKNARGMYITYLDDDDKFYPNHLEVLSQALDEHPEAALAYSDLYAVSCVEDKAAGKRYIVDKRIQVSRDFNREFMFHYNHVLHVSLMHRKEAAFRVGCYDEEVKVLIEWSLNRRLCFIYDFIHVPVVTGEYYMPIFKSDRISVVQRKNKESYRHNFRKIKANLPPLPWPKVAQVAVILPVARWDDSQQKKVEDIFDHISYPCRFILVNNGRGRTKQECRAVLGKMAELRNISILNTPRPFNQLETYRYAAQKCGAEYVFLATENLWTKESFHRVMAGLEILKKGDCEAVKWEIAEEKKTHFDLLIKKEVFLRKTAPHINQGVNVKLVLPSPPSAFEFDFHFNQAKRLLAKDDPRQAFELAKKALAVGHGAPGLQYMIHFLMKCGLAAQEYDYLQARVQELLDQGYEPDNWIRLGQVYQHQGRMREAIEAYQRGLKSVGLSLTDLEAPVFPISFPKEFSAFTALIGLGECYFELMDKVESARNFHRAAKLRANSHKPFLGFAKLYLSDGQLEKAEFALNKVGERDGKDPETHRVLGRLCESRHKPELAFTCYLKALEHGRTDEKTIDPLFHVGSRLGKWEELRQALEAFLQASPDSLPAMARLAEVYCELGDYCRAAETSRRGLGKDPSNSILREILNQSQESQKDNGTNLHHEPDSPASIFDVKAPQVFG